MTRSNTAPLLLLALLLCSAACGSERYSDATVSVPPGTTSSSNGTPSTSNNTTATSNGTSSTSNGTTATSNGTTATSNGTTATSNGTTATSNGTTATSNGTTATSNGTTQPCIEGTLCGPELTGLCVDGLCALECDLGTLACYCHPDGDPCDAGLVCTDGFCAQEEPLPGPPCYTPCANDFVRDGELLRCTNGLFLGCLGENVCTEGSCVTPGEQPASCTSPTQCPWFQNCVDGLCQSDCQSDTDCSGNMICADYACRLPCGDLNAPDTTACPDGMYCAYQQQGSPLCVYHPEHEGEPLTRREGTFTVSPTSMVLTRSTATTTLDITNPNPVRHTFTITKTWLLHYTHDNHTSVRCGRDAIPCDALELDGQDRDRIEIEVGPSESVSIALNITDVAPEIIRQHFELVVSSPTLGAKTIHVHNIIALDGQWAGEAVLFANFGTQGIADWQDDRENREEAPSPEIGNALIERWFDVRQGRLTWDDFKMVLSAVRSGLWRSTAEACATEACFLTPQGPRELSNDLEALPVPTGVVTTPLAVNIKRVPNTLNNFAGRVVGELVPHYASSPNLQLELSAGLENWAPDTMMLIQRMEARTVVGARFTTTSDNTDCDGREGYIFDSTLGLVAGEETIYTCTDTRSLLSSPVYDGRALERSIRVLDGAFIDASTLFVLLEETVESAESSVSTYGYAVLTQNQLKPHVTYAGTDPPETTVFDDRLAPKCSEEILEELSITLDDPAEAMQTLLEGNATVAPLLSEVEQSFAYRTILFGGSEYFAPEPCGQENSERCFYPDRIEHANARQRCLMALWQEHYTTLDPASQTTLNTYLHDAFTEGLPMFFAELHTSLGDESLIRASSNRWLNGPSPSVQLHNNLLDIEGLELGGRIGEEVQALYKATQHYQRVLNAFFEHRPLLERSTRFVDERNIASDAFERYLTYTSRASANQGRAWAKIAQIYDELGFNTQAQKIARRAATHLSVESALIADTTRRLLTNTLQSRQILERAHLHHHTALLRLYASFTNTTHALSPWGNAEGSITLLGQDDFVVRNPLERHAFRIRFRASGMQNAEQDFDVGAEPWTLDQFQENFRALFDQDEAELANICGTFEGEDGRIHPSIARNAYMTDTYSDINNLCGNSGSGKLRDLYQDINLDEISATRNDYNASWETLAKQITDVSEQCNTLLRANDYLYQSRDGEPRSLHEVLEASRLRVDRFQTAMVQHTCTTPECQQQHPLFIGELPDLSEAIAESQKSLLASQNSTGLWRTTAPCDTALALSNAKTLELLQRLKAAELSLLNIYHSMYVVMHKRQIAAHQASILQAELDLSEQSLIALSEEDSRLTRRLIRNSKVVNLEAWLANLIGALESAIDYFEYTTQMSYARRTDLPRLRSVSLSDSVSAEDFWVDFEDAIIEREEQLGIRNTRVLAPLSLRDDLLKLPKINNSSQPLTENARAFLLRKALLDPAKHDSNGYSSVPFDLFNQNIPINTFQHTISTVEADVFGTNMGDNVGRLYLSVKGAHAVHNTEGMHPFYSASPRFAVIIPVFNHNRIWDDAIYQNVALKDHALKNTRFVLNINQASEQDNQDIDLGTLSDIRLQLYYTDISTN